MSLGLALLGALYATLRTQTDLALVNLALAQSNSFTLPGWSNLSELTLVDLRSQQALIKSPPALQPRSQNSSNH